MTLRRVGDVQYAIAAYHIPSGSHEEIAAISVLGHLLGTQPAGRLYRNVVATGLAAHTWVSTYQLREPGVLIAGTEVRRNDDLGKAAAAMLETLQGLAHDPPTVEEVDRAKATFATEFELAFNDAHAIGRTLGEWASMGDWRLMFLRRDRIAEVTPSDVLAVATKYLMTSNRTTGYFHPTDETPPRAEIPATPEVAAVLSGYAGSKAVSQGEAFDPAPGNIERRTTRYTLPSGIKVALLPKENRGDGVTALFTFRHGTEHSLTGRNSAAVLAAGMLGRGTTRRSQQELVDEFLRLQAGANVRGGPTRVDVSAITVRENLPEVLRLVAEILRKPVFAPAEFELLREENLAAIESQRSDLDALLENALNRHVFGSYDRDHVLHVPTFDELIARYNEVTVEQARDFWASFYGAEGGTVAIVGDFEPEAILPILEEGFGDWSAPEAYAPIARPYSDVPAVTVDIEMPDKANASMVAFSRIRMRDDHADYPALVLANHVLGIRLNTRIRQQEGLTYDVGSEFTADSILEEAAFVGHAIFAPENADRVVSAFREEIDRMLARGFTADEVETARRGLLDRAHRQWSNDHVVAWTLNANLFLDRTMGFFAQLEAALGALTADDLLRAVRRHIDPKRMSIFRAGDLANRMAP